MLTEHSYTVGRRVFRRRRKVGVTKDVKLMVVALEVGAPQVGVRVVGLGKEEEGDRSRWRRRSGGGSFGEAFGGGAMGRSGAAAALGRRHCGRVCRLDKSKKCGNHQLYLPNGCDPMYNFWLVIRRALVEEHLCIQR